MEWVSWFTDLRPRLVLGFIAVIGLALSGHYRLAALTGAVAAVIGIPVNGLDLFGGIVADRIRPNGAPFLAYPSGHTLGTIVQYGFAIFLAFRLAPIIHGVACCGVGRVVDSVLSGDGR